MILILLPVFTSNNIIFPYSINNFNICLKYPKIWFYIKIFYFISFIISSIIISNFIFNKFIKHKLKIKNNINLQRNKDKGFSLLVGNSFNTKNPVFIPIKGLFQNILITGTIGSRKNKLSYVPILQTTNFLSH